MELYKTQIPEVNEVENLHDFYTYRVSEEEGRKTVKISIPKSKFIRLLKRAGFYKFYIDGLNASIVRVSSNKILTINEDLVFSLVKEYINALPVRTITIDVSKKEQLTEDITPQRIIDALIDSTTGLSHKSTFFHLDKIEAGELLHDDDGVKYFYFNNTVVRIRQGEKPQLIPYENLNKKVWQANIIDRDYTPLETGGLFGDYFEIPTKKGFFEQFFEKITGQDEQRKKSLMSMLGYLLHNFFDTNLFAIWITDVNAEFEARAGRTGKGLLVKAMRQMCNRDYYKDKTLVSVKGNTFSEFNEKRYSDVEVNTQVISIEDMKKIKPDALITDITEGIDVRKMYTDTFRHLAKFYISTNFAPSFESQSDVGRAKIFELANYYRADYTPMDEFRRNGKGVWFFGNDFTEQDWNEFYSFMIRCANEYIQNGITEAEDINFTERSLLEQTNEDFLFFIGEQFADFVNSAPLKMGTFKKISYDTVKDRDRTPHSSELFAQYMLKYDNTLSWTKDKSSIFWRWVRLYCQKKSIQYCEKKSVQEFYIFPDSHTLQQCKMQQEKYNTKK